MPASAELRFRVACPGDAQAIAGLHADSWQRHYRGAFSDAFLDNLHVRHGLKRRGTGTRLLALTGLAVLDWSPSSGLYLWVLEQNRDARAFYAARGAICVERADVPPPGGDPARLHGQPIGLRYAWRDPSRTAHSRPRPSADRRFVAACATGRASPVIVVIGRSPGGARLAGSG
jgi:GNAT superfamily N-acetyltransferase